jgi:phosphatidylglycerophosphate synthase
MPDYEPTSRRPITEGFRRTAQGATRLCLRLGIHPDAISYFSVLAAALAALLFWRSGAHPILLLFAPGFCYVRLWCNMLDGMVALAAGKASWRGEILNDLPDRISDVLIFAGAAHSGGMNPIIGYWAAIFALLTAYVGMFGQAVGVQREFSGVMSKPWRMVALHAGAWTTLACVWWNSGAIRFASLTVLDWVCVIVMAGCVQTMTIRLKRIMAALRSKSAAN